MTSRVPHSSRDGVPGLRGGVVIWPGATWAAVSGGVVKAAMILAILGATIGCGSLHGVGSMPAELVDVPDRMEGVDARVFAARKLRDRGDPVGALKILAGVLSTTPRHVNAHRLRQDILRSRGRTGLLHTETAAWIAERPEDPAGYYLQGRLLPAGPTQAAAFRRAVELDPSFFWGWLGLAWSLTREQPDAALAMYQSLYTRTNGSPLVAVALGRLLRRRDQPAAMAIYRTLASRPDDDGVGMQGMAETDASNADARRRALLQRPFDIGVQRIFSALALGGSRNVAKELLSTLRAKPEVLRAFTKGDFGRHVAAQLFLRDGHADAAFEVLDANRGGRGPRTARARRLWMRLLLARGEVAKYLQMLRQEIPEQFLTDESNQVRGRWLRVLDGGFTEAQLDDPVALHEFADALTAAGMLEDGESLLDRALSVRDRDVRESGWRALHELRTKVRSERAFQAQVELLLTRGLRAPTTAPIETVIGEIRQLSVELLGRDVVGEPQLFRVPLVGAMVDPLQSPLAEHFASFNRHLELGQRRGAAVEWFACVRLSVRDLPNNTDLPLPARCTEIVGTARSGQTRGIAGGDVAGVALLNHYVVDMNAVRDWANSVIRHRTIARADGEELVRDPLPALAGEGDELARFRPAVLDGLDVAWRLAMASPLADAEIEGAVLDIIRKHERAHLVDSFHFLPVESHLLRAMGLAISHGLSPLAVEGTMEGRAELAALAASPHTELVLAHIAEFLDSRSDSSPHALGFRQLAVALVHDLAVRGVPLAGRRAAAWDQLDAATVRELARNRLNGLW